MQQPLPLQKNARMHSALACANSALDVARDRLETFSALWTMPNMQMAEGTKEAVRVMLGPRPEVNAPSRVSAARFACLSLSLSSCCLVRARMSTSEQSAFRCSRPPVFVLFQRTS